MHLPLVAEAYADKVIIEALWRFLPIAIIAVGFGFVYWLVRRHKAAREQAALTKWSEERKAKRSEKKATPDDR